MNQYRLRLVKRSAEALPNVIKLRILTPRPLKGSYGIPRFAQVPFRGLLADAHENASLSLGVKMGQVVLT